MDGNGGDSNKVQHGLLPPQEHVVETGNRIAKMLSSSAYLRSFAGQDDLRLLQKLLGGKVYVFCIHVFSTGVRDGA